MAFYDLRLVQMYLSFSRFFFRYRQWGIGPDDLVLDVGSGAAPNPRANVLCDRAASDNRERENDKSLVFDRPAVFADAERLPFKDKAFDFVICAHMLEHVERPKAVVAELTRVARRGYIETPSPVWERMHATPYHRWVVSRQDRTLRFVAKQAATHDRELDDWRLAADASAREAMLALHYHMYDAGLITELVWDEPFEPIVEGTLPAQSFVEASTGGDEFMSGSSGLKDTIKAFLGTRIRERGQRRLGDIVDVLRCPKCAHDLVRKNGAVVCGTCGTTVPLTAGVPTFV